MNPNNTIEYNSLSWVKAQLDDVMSDAQANLNDYIDNKEDVHLENCIEHLQLIYGTLQMVEVYGASALAEEMKLTTAALLEGSVESEYDAYDILMRAMLQLPDYLESVQSGKVDSPITLMPLINDLRVVRNESLLTEGALFSPDIKNAVLQTQEQLDNNLVIGNLEDEVKRLRTHFQLGLLDYIKNNKERSGLQRIKAVLSSLEKVSSNAEIRNIWMITGALTEGVINKGIETSFSVKSIFSNIDRQLKLILEVGEDEFANSYSQELVKNALYHISLCAVESPNITNVKEIYKLNNLAQQESEESQAAIGGLNSDLFDTVSKGITEDLSQVKDVLELFMHSSEQELERLIPVAEQLGKVGDTYSMIGMEDTKQHVLIQRDALERIIKGEEEVSEEVILEIASGVLKAESELKDYIAERSGLITASRGEESSVVPTSEYRDVMVTVVSEAMSNFSKAKEAILAYIAGSGDKNHLNIILDSLEEVRGVAMMLPLRRVGSQIEKLQEYIRIVMIKNDHEVKTEEQDTVADVVTSIEYFFEALSEGRPGVEQGLNAGDIAADKLIEITKNYSGTVDETIEVVSIENDVLINNQQEEPLLEDSLIENAVGFEEIKDVQEIGELEEDDLIEINLDEELVVSVDENESSGAQVAENVAPQYNILADDADEEIVEIFIEEAIEVLGELHEYLPQWQADYNNEEALAVIRRSFHTLKGSGRLLGAEMIGEFSWKFENMLNSYIENKIIVSDAMQQTLDEALAVLPQLIEQLKGNREPIDNIEQLMAAADSLAEGREVVDETADVLVVDEITVDEPIVDELPVQETALDELTIDLSDEINVNEDIISNEDLSIDDSIEISEVISVNEEINIDDEFIIEEEANASDNDALSEEIKLDDYENISIGDDSDIDISELDTVNNFSSEEIIIDEFDNEVVTLEFDAKDTDVAESNGTDSITEESFEVSDSDEIEVINTEGDQQFGLDDELGIDPMLLQIYHDESIGHLETVRQKLDEHESGSALLQADKDLMRAFHTLNGSARTAEVDAIADLAGTVEKYIKARQDGGDESIPEAITIVIREVETNIAAMLAKVIQAKCPATNKELHDRVNKIVQQEIQSQLQQSWQDNSAPQEIGDEEIIAVSTDTVSDLKEDDLDVVSELDIENQIDEVEEQSFDDIREASVETENTLEAAKETVEALETRIEDIASTLEMSYGDIDDELIDIFLEEAEELVENCEQTLAEIQDQPASAEHIHQLQRNMHTLKGGARMADLTPVGDLTHNLETLVVMVAENKVKVDKEWFDLIQESLDSLTTMLNNVRKRQPLSVVGSLNNRIEKMIRGETHEKRAIERFDLEIDDLESVEDDELENIDVTDFTAERRHESDEKQPNNDENHRRKADNLTEKPHWGERATDVNYKESQEQVRVRSDLLNDLVDYAGEVNIYHARMGKQVTDFGFNLSELTQTVVRLKEQLRNLEIETEIQIRSGYEKEADNFDDGFDPLEMDQYSTMQQLTRSLGETAADVESINDILTDITRDSETLLVQESRISSDLQEGLMRTRMVRFGGLTSRLRRIVRQVSRELGKEVELVIDGEGCEVDRTVLDRVIAPLEHMLRNAVAHGIESPEGRRVLGKKESGTISINVSRQGTNVLINVKDDGAGINTDKIREKAIEQKLLAEDSKLSDRDVLQFILHSGFSTADEVTQIAGRGVGMDVVDSEIKQLGGVLEIDTVQGRGTEFTVRLPLTLAINQALLVSAADDVFAVPLASIEGVVRITGVELQRFYDSNNSFYEFNDVEYELKHLGGLLSGNQADYSKQLQLYPLLLVHVGDQHFALHVEDLLGRREIVVKPVGMQIGSVHGIAGATILADGRVVMILEMSALVMAESLFKPAAIVDVVEEPIVDDVKTVMVVDDSITIRKITERMLKRYGIEVVLAKDGVDATNLLQEHVPDLMLLDIEMPRMDGFEVASFVRNDERLKDLPIIMITSRTGTKHKEKAMEIGVNQYLGKPFQEDDLISNINEILNTTL